MVLDGLVETHKWWPPVSACLDGKGLNKGTLASPSTSLWEEAASLTFTMMPDSGTPVMTQSDSMSNSGILAHGDAKQLQ